MTWDGKCGHCHGDCDNVEVSVEDAQPNVKAIFAGAIVFQQYLCRRCVAELKVSLNRTFDDNCTRDDARGSNGRLEIWASDTLLRCKLMRVLETSK